MNKKEFDQSNMDEKFEFLYNGLSWLYKEMESLKQAAPTKKKSKKETWPRDLSFEEFIKKSFKQAERSVNNRLEKKGFDLVTKVTWMEALEKAQADKTFMENYAAWMEGNNNLRPTMFFNGIDRGINHLKFNTAGEFRKSTFTKRVK